MPATQSGAAPRATNGDQRRPSAPPSATSATPATPNAGKARHQVLCATPAMQKVARRPGRPTATNGDQRRPSAPPSATSATPATPNAGRCLQVPRLPRDCNKCHACLGNEGKCHLGKKWRGAPGDPRRPSAPPSATCTTPATPNAGRCLQVSRLPRETKVDVTVCSACHAKNGAAATNPVQARHQSQPSAL